MRITWHYRRLPVLQRAFGSKMQSDDSPYSPYSFQQSGFTTGASEFLDEPRQSMGSPIKSTDAQLPSEKQVKYAQSLALQAQQILPDEVLLSREGCSAFIDSILAIVPPSEKQIEFATQLAEKAGEQLDERVLESAKECSKYIDKMLEGARTPQQSNGMPNIATTSLTQLPSDKQLSFAINLARAAKVGLPAEVLLSKVECSQFIESLKSRPSPMAVEQEQSPRPFQDADIPF
eukprot:CAMPEP_0119313690 /NCGR_PEP_ID=MMETSP1333-20130426/30012_1 /TAXON_ID=418940 /ORGANISM="Scyphosphaera apsteinii, Strain RCC1455" /LENGTH=232 /DNA_ID=CAMNT_0007318587 /DNA_START=89 /DNA_END=787 /DNA_ORIENTATION=+